MNGLRISRKKESEEQVTPVLVIRERRQKMTWAMLLLFPYNKITLRCDNEPAIEALAREIAQVRQEGSQTVPVKHQCGRASPMGSPNVQWDSWPARTLKAALGHRIGTRIPPDARILCWLVEFAAYLMISCDIGRNGKRCTGERATHRCWNSGRRFCTCGPSHHEEESGNRDSILVCLLAC